MDKLRTAAPYISVFGLFVMLSSLVTPVLARSAGNTPPDWLGRALLIAGAVLALAWPVLCWEDAKELLGSRQARYGSNALLLTVAMLVLLGVANFFGTRFYTTVDLTENKRFSISNQTKQILDDLKGQKKELKLTAILSRTDENQAAELERLIDRYKQRYPTLSYQRLDPQVDLPALMGLAQRIGQDQPPGRALVVESGAKHAIAYSFDEQEVTSSIVKATRAKESVVAFTTGHGECGTEAGEQGKCSYAGVKQGLEREGYKVTSLNLSALTDTIKADVVIVAGPSRAFLPAEAKTLTDWVKGGGKVMLLLGPDQDPGLADLLGQWDIQPNKDVVIQVNRLGQQSAAVAVVDTDYQFHATTKGLNSFQTVLIGTQSFSVGTPADSNLTNTKLLEVKGPGVYGETDLAGLADQKAEQGPEDKASPLTLAVAGEGGEKGGRLVLFGTSALADDAALQQFPPGATANGDLFLNSVSWLAQDESLIAIRATEPDSRPITPPQNPLLVLLTTLILIPGAIAAIGFWIWWGRR